MSKCKLKLKLTLVDWKNEGFSDIEKWCENYIVSKLRGQLDTLYFRHPNPHTSALKDSGDIFINNDELYKVEVVSHELDFIAVMKIDDVEKYCGGYFITGEYDNSSATLRNFLNHTGRFMERYLEEQ